MWKASTQLGCALVNCAAGSIFDASYGVGISKFTDFQANTLEILGLKLRCMRVLYPGKCDRRISVSVLLEIKWTLLMLGAGKMYKLRKRLYGVGVCLALCTVL